MVRAALARLPPRGRAIVAALASLVALQALASDGSASGTLSYASRGAPITVALHYAWLFRGPDAVDAQRTIRRLIFSSSDIRAALAACPSLSCTDAALGSGMTLDLDNGPRLNYWVSLDHQRVQYSGSARPDALALTTQTPSRLAGRLTLDDSAAGGAKVDVSFDTPLVAALKLAR